MAPAISQIDPSSSASAWPSIDIVIDNHNYGRYLRAAIESALGQTYPSVSVIAVDDGSSDCSGDVIASFGRRIVPVMKENGGQASAFNAGLAVSHGDVVVFLDSDDVLTPHAAERIAAAFRERPGLAKVHFRLAVIDEAGRATGEIKPSPHIALPKGDLTAATLRFPFDLARPATSGNAYSSRVLRAMAPIRDCGDRIGADWYLVHIAALFGPVGAIDEPLALYRLHGANLYAGTALPLDLVQIRATIGYVERTRGYLAEFAGKLGLERRSEDASMSEVADRAISRKLDPARHPIAGDTLPHLVRLGARAARRRFDIAGPMKLAFVVWLVCLIVSPRPVARKFAELFVDPGRRPRLNRWLKRMNRR